MNINQKTQFFIVTTPDKDSEIQDICFQTDLNGLRNQFLGGLASDEIHGIYDNETEAITIAQKLLTEVQ